MANQKKFKPRKPEQLKRKAQNPLDERILEMKRKSRKQAELTVGDAVAAAAEAYDRGQHGDANAGNLANWLPMQDDEWEDVEENVDVHPDNNARNSPTPVVPNMQEQYAYGLNKGFYAGRQQAEEEQWRNRFPAMFPEFLLCQQRTSNWSKPDTYCTDWKEPCNCASPLRTLDVLDLMCELVVHQTQERRIHTNTWLT
jgi:hypothetical protein